MTGTSTETNFVDLSEYAKAIRKEIDSLVKEGLEKCGYDMEWFKANIDRFSAVNDILNKATVILIDHKPLFKIISEYDFQHDNDQNIYNFKCKIHIEYI